MKINYLEFTFSDHFLCALINDDYSGLENDEIKILDSFLFGLPEGVFVCDSMDDTNFDVCEITGLYSNCTQARYQLIEVVQS